MTMSRGPLTPSSDESLLVLTPTPGANSKVKLPASSPAYVSGTLGDPTDPASVQGLTFTVADSDADAAGLTVTATSSNPSVGAATLSGSGKTRLLKISPRQTGYADMASSGLLSGPPSLPGLGVEGSSSQERHAARKRLGGGNASGSRWYEAARQAGSMGG